MADIIKENGAEEEMEEVDVVTLTDENGEEMDFVVLGETEMDGAIYYAMIPIEEGSDEYVILKVVTDENGEDMLESVDDDDEFDKVADIFDDMFMDTDYDK